MVNVTICEYNSFGTKQHVKDTVCLNNTLIIPNEHSIDDRKEQVGDDQELVKSERKPHSKNRGGKN